MATADSKRMYSWWWDSHISPKNSKWLQENLTDMDSKVKQMIKVIEEDADSFARRAEMYYKKRPELMKLVEEFYRAYRALVERYDHATGVIRQAHRTMAEAFPNQVPFILSDESPSDFSAKAVPHTPEVPHPMRALFDTDEIQKDASGFSSHFHVVKRSDDLTEEPDSTMNRMGLKQLNDLFGNGEGTAEGKARKGLNFHDMEERDRSSQKCGDFSESDRVSKAETETLNLKKSLTKLEAEKEAGLLQYQQSVDRLSNLESEVSRAQEDSQGLNVRASKLEVEVQNLKETLTKLEAEREISLFQYQQCLEKISYLESRISSAQKNAGELTERATKAEIEVKALKQDLARIEAEKETSLLQYNKCLEMISNLEEKLLQAEEESKRINERADKAECDVEILKEEIARLIEEKEIAALCYQECLETISELEQKLSSTQEEAQRLNSKIEDGVAKLKAAEEMCVLLEKSNQTLQSELESFVHRVGSQGVELAENQKELRRLWTCIQEERMRFLEAETAFQTLQHLHSQSEEELRSMVAELQNRDKILNDMETQNRGLEDEIQKVKEENKSLNELNLSSAVSITNLQGEISNLKETIRILEEEVDLRVDQRNALQQEIYVLKEELNNLNKEHMIILEQVDSVGFDPKCFGSSIKELQNEKSELKQVCDANINEKEALLEKLVVMEKLTERNYLLENSLADLNVELEDVRKNVQSLEQSCQSLLDENANLVSQLQIATKNLDKLAEKRFFLESSLSEANDELEVLRVKSRNLEDSCLLLNSEKIDLTTERESLVTQLNISWKKLEDIANSYTALENKLSDLEKERESALHVVEELSVFLDAEKQERVSFAQLSETRLACMEFQICHLQDEIQHRKKDYEEEQDKALNAHLEILILLKFIEDLEGKSFSLLMEHQKLLNASKLSKKLISELDHEIIDRQVELKSLSEENEVLRMGLYQVLKTLDIGENHECPSKMEEDQELLKHILIKLKEAQYALVRSCNESDQLVIEKSILVTVMKQQELERVSVMEERDRIGQELRTQYEQFLALQGETQRLGQMNEELRLKAAEEGDRKEKVFTSKLDDLQKQLLEFQGAYRNLQEENHKAVEDKTSLNKKVMALEEEICYLKEECVVTFGEKLFHSNLSLIFNDIISKSSMELEEINGDYNRIHLVNLDLMGKLRMFEEKFDYSQKENLYLKDSVSKLDNDLFIKKSLNQQLNGAKNLLSQKSKEIQMLESQAVATLGELLIFTVFKTVLEGKILELAELYKSLQNQSNFNNMEIELLKEKVCALEDANGGLQAQLDAYLPAVISLNDCKTSLEKHTLKHSRSHKFDLEDAHQLNLLPEISQTREDHFAAIPDGISNLPTMQSRVRDIQNAVMEKERLMVLENFNANGKLDSLMDIEGLKDGNSSCKENGWTNKLVPGNNEAKVGNGHGDNLKLKRHTYEISDSGSEVLTKDILLDQGSDSSSYGINKIETAGVDDQMLKLWDITDHDASVDLMVGNTQKVVAAPPDHHDAEASKEHKGSRYPLTESMVVKDLDVDISEISKRFADSRHEGNNIKILERLDSDVKKLTNLQITVQDLKRKVEVTGKNEKAKDIELNTVKAQLEEAEESIVKLFEGNCKLMKNIEEGVSISHEGMLTIVSEESGSISRRRTSELARRGSEQIGRLQLEVQKLQFLLLKLDEKNGSRGITRIANRKTRVHLKDYLYGGGVRTGKKPKKALFCGCMKAPN